MQVKNTGKRRGTEVAQLYVQDVAGDVTRPVRELKAFQRIELAAGESRRVSFKLDTTKLVPLCRMVAELTGIPLSPMKPVAGDKISK